jgi:hypothetical protein
VAGVGTAGTARVHTGAGPMSLLHLPRSHPRMRRLTSPGSGVEFFRAEIPRDCSAVEFFAESISWQDIDQHKWPAPSLQTDGYPRRIRGAVEHEHVLTCLRSHRHVEKEHNKRAKTGVEVCGDTGRLGIWGKRPPVAVQ